MRKNLLRQLTLALLLTAAVPTLTAQVHVGDILCEGNAIISPANYPSSGATAIGVVFYVDNTGQHGWAVALENSGNYNWSGDGDYPLPDYTNQRQAIQDLDGYENTRIMRENSSNHPAFDAVDFANGWYLPAIGQLNYLYGNIIEVNAGLNLANGTSLTGRYWSSTEYDYYHAWYLELSGNLGYLGDNNIGNGYYNSKRSYRLVRAARNF